MDYITTDTELTSIANAIRTKGGTSGQLVYPNGFVSAIGDISSGTDIGAEDEGKVVHNGELVAQTSRSISSNGTYDTTLNDEVVVAVSGGGGDAPDKFYIESQDGTVSMLFEKDGDDLRQTVYFNGYTKGSDDNPLTFPLSQFVPYAVLITKAYDSANGEWIGNIGFNMNGRTRSWSKDNALTLAGTFWGTLYLVNGALDPDKATFVASGGTVQDVPYEAPVVPSGGGAKNILSGTEEPSANVGTNGDIYLMYAGEGNSVELSLSTKKEDSMSVTIDGDSVSFVYNSGAYIGAHVYQLIDLTNVTRISFTVAIGTHHYGRSRDTRFNPVLMLAPQGGSLNPAGSFASASNITSYGVWTGGADGTTETVTIDISEYAGRYYVIFAGTGCTVRYGSIRIGNNEGEIIETYLKASGAWNPIRLQDIDDVNMSGGGSAKNILLGDAPPNVQDGNNGDIFLYHMEEDSSVLPNEYTRLPSTNFTGNQYVNTGYISNENSKFSLCFMPVTGGSGYDAPFGARSIASIGADAEGVYVIKGDTGRFGYCFGTALTYGRSPEYYNDFVGRYSIVTLDANSVTMLCVDTVYSHELVGGEPTEYPIYIGGINQGGTVASNTYAAMKLYWFKIYESGVLVHNFIPAEDQNSVVGLYDTVGQQFYGSSNANQLVAGTDQPSDTGLIIETYLKVNGQWQPIKGQSFHNVNIGDNEANS